MAILADFHMHTEFSADSKAPLSSMVEGAINKGLKHICITEHMDHDFPLYDPPIENLNWEVNVDSYLYELLNARQKYEKDINVGFGIELGLQESAFRANALTAKGHEFDFIIGSIHLVNKMDPWFPAYFEGRDDRAAFEDYFKAIKSNIQRFNNFDVLGHMDYVVRYSPNKDANYNPMDYSDLVDDILTTLIENEKGIEINTSGLYNNGMKYPNPHPDILKRYKELGGEIVTIGSDAHKPENIALSFDIAEEMLVNAGFKYYTTFEQRVAHFNKL